MSYRAIEHYSEPSTNCPQLWQPWHYSMVIKEWRAADTKRRLTYVVLHRGFWWPKACQCLDFHIWPQNPENQRQNWSLLRLTFTKVNVSYFINNKHQRFPSLSCFGSPTKYYSWHKRLKEEGNKTFKWLFLKEAIGVQSQGTALLLSFSQRDKWFQNVCYS